MTLPDPEKNRRILIVDDDRDFADILGLTLTRSGYMISVVYNEQQALQEIQDFPADLALIDFRLGLTTSLELIKSLQVRKPDLVCVVLTADANPETFKLVKENGARDILRKPFNPTDLLDGLNRWI